MAVRRDGVSGFGVRSRRSVRRSFNRFSPYLPPASRPIAQIELSEWVLAGCRGGIAMRTLIAVGTALLLTSARGSTDFDLRGIARAGERPQANAVVWLEAPNAPARTPSQKTVLDQRVLASGEWITGQPFDGTTTDGWHADVAVHRPPIGPLMAVSP